MQIIVFVLWNGLDLQNFPQKYQCEDIYVFCACFSLKVFLHAQMGMEEGHLRLWWQLVSNVDIAYYGVHGKGINRTKMEGIDEYWCVNIKCQSVPSKS